MIRKLTAFKHRRISSLKDDSFFVVVSFVLFFFLFALCFLFVFILRRLFGFAIPAGKKKVSFLIALAKISPQEHNNLMVFSWARFGVQSCSSWMACTG